MCTVTFIARKRGYSLGMNRDEKLTRPTGLTPKRLKVGGCAIIGPSEPGGGKWITVNDRGVAVALVNWYSIETRVAGKAVSRGEVVNSVSAATSPESAQALLATCPLERINPFRLIGVFPQTNEIVEWRWDLQKLTRKSPQWKTQQWISSGYDEPSAQRIRGRTFRKARNQTSAGSLDWLRRLHRSHRPEACPFSTCMHRADAATVSYTEISVSSHGSVMKYQAGAPCQHCKCSSLVMYPLTAKSMEGGDRRFSTAGFR